MMREVLVFIGVDLSRREDKNWRDLFENLDLLDQRSIVKHSKISMKDK